MKLLIHHLLYYIVISGFCWCICISLVLLHLCIPIWLHVEKRWKQLQVSRCAADLYSARGNMALCFCRIIYTPNTFYGFKSKKEKGPFINLHWCSNIWKFYNYLGILYLLVIHWLRDCCLILNWHKVFSNHCTLVKNFCIFSKFQDYTSKWNSNFIFLTESRCFFLLDS